MCPIGRATSLRGQRFGPALPVGTSDEDGPALGADGRTRIAPVPHRHTTAVRATGADLATVRNLPSDGEQRQIANEVGAFIR